MIIWKLFGFSCHGDCLICAGEYLHGHEPGVGEDSSAMSAGQSEGVHAS